MDLRQERGRGTEGAGEREREEASEICNCSDDMKKTLSKSLSENVP